MGKDTQAGSDSARAMGRRAFLRQGALTLSGAGLASMVGSRPAGAQAPDKTQLVMVRHAGATDDQGAGYPDIVTEMVNRCIRELTGKDSIADAWRVFVSPDDVVGLKLNVRGGPRLSPQPCAVKAIVAGLVAAGVKENHVIIWDAWCRELPTAGFALSNSGQGTRCYGTDKGSLSPGENRSAEASRDAAKTYYSDTPVPVADKAVYFSKILSEEITALINIPLIKDHMIAGVTCSMKNHFGSILNPRDLHGNRCDPYLAELNATALIKSKTRLIFVDGLRALYNGGPRDHPKCRWRQNSFIAGTDPVAVDALALRIIEEKRKEAGLEPIGDRARYIATAARLGLGTDDFARIDLREIDCAAPA